MNVGFTILGSSINKRDKKSVTDFLVSTYIFPTKEIASSIVHEVIKGADVSVYAEGIDYSLVASQPWQYRVISVPDGRYIVVSAVDFKLELKGSDRIIILQPTEYKEVSYDEAVSFAKEIKQGLVKVLPTFDEDIQGQSNWILRFGYWEDDMIWVDSQKWKH